MYVYTNNNPIKFIDPMGHAIFIGLLIGIASVGSVIIGNSIYQKNKAKNEVNKLQKRKQIPDKTKEIDNMLKRNASDVKKATQNMNEIKKLNYFMNNVKTGAKYDLKSKKEWKGKVVKYNGKVMEDQDIGNLNFGYIGRSLGYSDSFLTTGAGLYQLKSGTSRIRWCFTSSLCDDPRDSYYVSMGIIKYDNEN